MAWHKVLQLWARNQGKSLRSGSLFNQPVAVRADNSPVGGSAPLSAADPDGSPGVRVVGDTFFIKDGAAWKALGISLTTTQPKVSLPSRFEKGDHTLEGDADTLQWDTDDDFFYLAVKGSMEWKRTALQEVPLKDFRGISFLNGTRMVGLDGRELGYLQDPFGVIKHGYWDDSGNWNDATTWTD